MTPDDEGVELALAAFNEALRIDPQFAPAYASLSRVHIARAVHYREQPRRALEAARAAAKRGLELEPELFEGHLALADVRRMLEWDWRGAETAYVQAIALNPSQENAHRAYAAMLMALSRPAEAIREAERACELDPLCLVVNTNAAWVRYLAGDYEAALERCQRTAELDPQYLPARRMIGAIFLQAGKTADAIEVLEAAHAEARQDPILGCIARARESRGRRPRRRDGGARGRFAGSIGSGTCRRTSWRWCTPAWATLTAPLPRWNRRRSTPIPRSAISRSIRASLHFAPIRATPPGRSARAFLEQVTRLRTSNPQVRAL